MKQIQTASTDLDITDSDKTNHYNSSDDSLRNHSDNISIIVNETRNYITYCSNDKKNYSLSSFSFLTYNDETLV